MKTPTMAIQASSGRWFAVKYLPTGARYGRTNVLVVDVDTVEFWDLTLADDSSTREQGWGPLGQFVSRYAVSTLLGEDDGSVTPFVNETGLCLDGGFREEWSVDAVSMRVVRSWARRMRAEIRYGRRQAGNGGTAASS